MGDAAILSAILAEVTKHLPTAQFYVPTTNPSFINTQYGKRYNVKALDIMPWNGALRFLGLPSLRCLWKSDVALICDGIIFGKRFFNPTFNLLITLAPLAFFAKLFGCKLVCYCVGIGPFPKGHGSAFARYLIQHCDLIMMREAESKATAEALGVTKPIELTGDAAYINPVSSRERALEIAQRHSVDLSKPLLGINVTKYVDMWINEGGETSDADLLIGKIAEGVKQAQSEVQGAFNPVIFCTHPMDIGVGEKLSALLKAPMVSSTEYLSHDLQAVMQLCSLFIGMRFHSLVLSSAVGVPVVGLVYAPKVRGLMRDLQSPELAVELASLTPQTLSHSLVQAWNNRELLQQKQQVVVGEFKKGAQYAATQLVGKFFTR